MCFTDDEECLTGKCPTHSANCTNTPGSYICTCKDGWKDDVVKICKGRYIV